MAIPKMWNRRIVVDNTTYIWYLRGDDPWTDSKHIAIRQDRYPQGQLLLLDFSAHDFEIRPRAIREAIEFALQDGWVPASKKVPVYVGFDNVQFVLVPPGEQYTRVLQFPPSVLRYNNSLQPIETLGAESELRL